MLIKFFEVDPINDKVDINFVPCKVLKGRFASSPDPGISIYDGQYESI